MRIHPSAIPYIAPGLPLPKLERCSTKILVALAFSNPEHPSIKVDSHTMKRAIKMQEWELQSKFLEHSPAVQIPQVIAIPPTPGLPPQREPLIMFPPPPNAMSFANRMAQGGLDGLEDELGFIPSRSSRLGRILADGLLAEQERERLDQFFEGVPRFKKPRSRPSSLRAAWPSETPSERTAEWVLNNTVHELVAEINEANPMTMRDFNQFQDMDDRPASTEPFTRFGRLRVMNDLSSRRSPIHFVDEQPIVRTRSARVQPLSRSETRYVQTENGSESPDLQARLERLENRVAQIFAEEQLEKTLLLAEELDRDPRIWEGANQLHGIRPSTDPCATIRAAFLRMKHRLEWYDRARPKLRYDYQLAHQ